MPVFDGLPDIGAVPYLGGGIEDFIEAAFVFAGLHNEPDRFLYDFAWPFFAGSEKSELFVVKVYGDIFSPTSAFLIELLY